MWKLKQFNGSSASEHVNNFVENNKIGDFEVAGFIQSPNFGVSILLKYWEETSLRKKLEPVKAAAFDEIFDAYKDLDLDDAESFKEIGKLINKGLSHSFDLMDKEKRLNNEQ